MKYVGEKGRMLLIEAIEEMEREYVGLGEAIKTVRRVFQIGEKDTFQERLKRSQEILARHDIDGSLVDSLIKERRVEAKKESKEIDERWEQYVEEERKEAEEVEDSHNNLEIQAMICKIMKGIDGATTQEIAQQLKDWGVVRKDSNFNRLVGSLCYGLQGQGKIFRDDSGDWMLVDEDDDE